MRDNRDWADGIAYHNLIQCEIEKMLENKAFHGFCGFVFSFFEPVSVYGSSSVL